MAEGTPSPFPSERHRSDDAPRGERSPGAREGGFRIRLSDNEMRSARALQDAFGLRSTVAVLGFALRTLGQQLEEGKLDELVAQSRAQAPARSQGEGGRPEGRRDRSEGRGGGGRGQEGRGSGGGGRPARVDPFARPPRPEAAPEAVAEAEVPASAEVSVETQDVEPTSESAAEPTAEPVAEPAGEPTVETVVEPTAEPTAETAAEPIAEPVTAEAPPTPSEGAEG